MPYGIGNADTKSEGRKKFAMALYLVEYNNGKRWVQIQAHKTKPEAQAHTQKLKSEGYDKTRIIKVA